MQKILFLHGSNMSVLDKRESFYGSYSYAQLVSAIEDYTRQKGMIAEFFVSNFEGELLEKLHDNTADAIVINPAAFSHYSLSLADAISMMNVPVIEVHLTNIFKRGREKSLTGAAAKGVISGFGIDGYLLAVDYLHNSALKQRLEKEMNLSIDFGEEKNK
jgi:3-dehydroquinate dehydratase-2